MTGPINPLAYTGIDYLTGTDVPADKNECSFKLLQFVIPSGKSLSALVAEISETYGKKYWGLNKSNIKKLAELGYSDFQLLIGKQINCLIDYKPNPQMNNALTRSLVVASVSDEK
jgi:hypothetical protein